MKKRTC